MLKQEISLGQTAGWSSYILIVYCCIVLLKDGLWCYAAVAAVHIIQPDTVHRLAVANSDLQLTTRSFIITLDHWCLGKLLGIKRYHHVRHDEVRRTTRKLHLLTSHAWRFSLFGHTVWMPHETDAKILTASPWRTGGDHQDALILRRWRLSSKTWNSITSPWMKQLTWPRKVHSGDWCLSLVLHTHRDAC